MKNEKFMSSLSKEIKQKFAQARVEPLDDKLLEEVAGGGVRVPRSFFLMIPSALQATVLP